MLSPGIHGVNCLVSNIATMGKGDMTFQIVFLLIFPVQLFTRKTAQLLYSNQRLQRWCFDVELLFLAQHLEVPVAEASVNWTEIPGDPSTLC